MAIEVGMILEGKVSGITKFGAFVDLPDSQTGMVHISEVAYKPAPPVKSPGNYEWQASKKNTPTSFEDMMSKFKQTSEDKISDLKRGGESRSYSRRGNGNGRK